MLSGTELIITPESIFTSDRTRNEIASVRHWEQSTTVEYMYMYIFVSKRPLRLFLHAAQCRSTHSPQVQHHHFYTSSSPRRQRGPGLPQAARRHNPHNTHNPRRLTPCTWKPSAPPSGSSELEPSPMPGNAAQAAAPSSIVPASETQRTAPQA